MMKHVTLSCGIGLIMLAGCATSGPPATAPPAYGAAGVAQMFDGMGPHERRVTTDSAEAQAYFNQGLNWLYAFNHDEAVRSFTRAAELDPDCAMAWWGVSYAQGPNYNDPVMPESRSEAAWSALQKARARVDDETPAERALIDALTHRYEFPAPEERDHLDAAFGRAMAEVWARFPNDSDVGTFYAESLMVQNPWELYTSDERPARDQTHAIIDTLERVVAMDPQNPGANHLYIHAVEPSADKERGIAAADRLSDLVPGSGHLMHMPSHIYVQTGRWERSIEQNAKAMRRDLEYRRLSPEQGMQNGYMTHNSHMLAFSAMMIGREREAMTAARAMWDDLPEEALRMVGPFFDPWMCSVYDVQKRFGRWDDLLAEPAPPAFLPTTTAVWRAHRAIAYAAKKDFKNAAKEQQAFRVAMKAIPETPQWNTYGTAMKFLLTSELFIEAEIALQKGKWDESASLLEQAVVIEDTLGYGEPPLWLQPVRHTLGAVYMKAGRYADAERVYRDDLDKWEGNGWSLYGLARALEEQGRTEEAIATRAAYDRAWSSAERPIMTSCMCIPET
ncbi:MAG: tetratricopeptide repeat protein [Phycisphaerales bacterium]|nr:tetratricopeptide repeat protein [Phycisphaerae bacterium]NNF45072.1 tetratricopeptide repeat protein [Phycisphaerales bacterium]NNM25901.1 tetratricopeptide repeat protein [Phycisphaerales bacterium]